MSGGVLDEAAASLSLSSVRERETERGAAADREGFRPTTHTRTPYYKEMRKVDYDIFILPFLFFLTSLCTLTIYLFIKETHRQGTF